MNTNDPTDAELQQAQQMDLSIIKSLTGGGGLPIARVLCGYRAYFSAEFPPNHAELVFVLTTANWLGKALGAALERMVESKTGADNIARDENGEWFWWDRKWIYDALMSCLELGLPVTINTALRLLGDRQFFEEQLPFAIESKEWAGASGTEIIRHWWLSLDDRKRQTFYAGMEKYFSCINQEEVKRWLVLHPGAGNRWSFSGHPETFRFTPSWLDEDKNA